MCPQQKGTTMSPAIRMFAAPAAGGTQQRSLSTPTYFWLGAAGKAADGATVTSPSTPTYFWLGASGSA
jgi:hypothetical protein